MTTVAVFGGRRVRSVNVLVRVRPVQESIVDLDGSDVFSGDERQLKNSDDCSTSNSEPSGSRATRAVHDTDERRRNSSRETAAGHGEAVDFAEDLGRRGGVFEQDKRSRVYYDPDEALHDQGDVDEGRGHVRGAGGDEGQHEVGNREEDDHPDEGFPDSDFLDEDGEDDGLDDEADGAVDGEVDSDVVDCHSETTLQVEVFEGGFGLVQDPGGEQAEVGHGVEGDDDQGEGQHDDSIVESLASVFRSRSTASSCAAGSVRSALCEIAADLGSLFRSESDRVDGGEGGFANVEILSNGSRETFLDERRPRCAACLRSAANRSGNAGSGCEKRRGFVKDTGVVVDGVVGLQLLGIGLLQKECSLNDGEDDDNDGDQIREQVRIFRPEAVRGEEARVEASRLSQESTHCRSENTTESPDKRLYSVCFGCGRCQHSPVEENKRQNSRSCSGFLTISATIVCMTATFPFKAPPMKRARRATQ
jgi:hypothetical protein